MTYLDFVDRSGEAARAVDALTGGGFWLDDRLIASSLGASVRTQSADLLTIAMSCYSADRMVRRPAAWKRELHLRVAVAEPEVFALHRDGLEAWLSLLTGDEWCIEVVSGRSARQSESQLLLDLPDAPLRAVGLFSGGLDSYAGAAVWLSGHPGSPLVLLAARSSTVTGAIQRQLAQKLSASFPNQVRLLAVPLHLGGTPTPERSQRTRGFLFQALSAVVADAAETSMALVFENGFGALNPRLVEQQVGAHMSRNVHPHLLTSWGKLARAIGFAVTPELPHRWETKGELTARISPSLQDGIKSTVSCDRSPRHRVYKQCGECGSCVLRRQALAAAGLVGWDRTDYREPPLGGSEVAQLMAFQAWQMLTATSGAWDEIEARWPQVTLGLSDRHSLEGEMTLALLRRYAGEWEGLPKAPDDIEIATNGWPRVGAVE